MSVLVTYIFGKDMDHGKAFQSVDDLIPENMAARTCLVGRSGEIVTFVLVMVKFMGSSITYGKLFKESITILTVDVNAFESSWATFKNQKSTRFSFTDCTTLSLMVVNHIDQLATFDEEFKSLEYFRVVQ